MTNSNCLEGIACPQCGNDFRIYIGVKTLAEVTDEGAETFGDMEWDGDSYAECPDCRHSGTLDGFRIDAATETSTSNDKES
jgi:DNA-directed RNA polymerase subunit RPC12/RpoP